MQSSFRHSLLVIFLSASFSEVGLAHDLLAQPILDWELATTSNNVAIYQQDTDNGHIKVRGIVHVHNRPEAFVELLEQTQLAPKWIAHNQAVHLLKANENVRLVHSKFDAPWPIRDRDMVTQSITYVEQGNVYIDIVDASEKHPELENFARIKGVSGRWTLNAHANRFTYIEYQGQANPGGNIPIWLANRTLISSIRETFENIVQQLDNPSLVAQD
ncbi:conserved hypothetical protein [Paraglaciecola sp. T6c]|nr:conserved hypothetical protein [Paraglaciecola sp. T6c]